MTEEQQAQPYEPDFANDSTFSPNADKMFIRPMAQSGMTTGGIHLPDNMKRNVVFGEVVDVGPEVEVYRPGDIVTFTHIEPLNLDRPEIQKWAPELTGLVTLHECKVVAGKGPGLRQRQWAAAARGHRMGVIPRLLGTSV